MKKLLPIILCLSLYPVLTNAQKVHFTDSSNVWYTNYSSLVVFGTYRTDILEDTSANGKDYKKIGEGTLMNSFALVREDTTANKVYLNMKGVDVLLYDYNLNVGDTFYYYDNSVQYKHVVYGVDSVRINSVWHKVQYFQPAVSNMGWPYIVVEGVGCVDGLTFPFWNYNAIEYHEQISCFYHKGTRPKFQIPSRPADTGSLYRYNYTDSCVVNHNYVSVSEVPAAAPKIVIAPNPIMSSSTLRIAEDITSADLYVFNSIGQVVVQKHIVDDLIIPIGTYHFNSGAYYYKLLDKESGHTYTGKFIVP